MEPPAETEIRTSETMASPRTSDLPARIWATAISGGSIAPDGTQTGEVSKDKLDIKIRIITMHSEVMITECLICTCTAVDTVNIKIG